MKDTLALKVCQHLPTSTALASLENAVGWREWRDMAHVPAAGDRLTTNLFGHEASPRPYYALTGRVRHLIVGLALFVISALLVVLALELTLRAYPTLLGETFASGALSKYMTRAGGIYYKDRHLRMNFMIPNMTTQMYANGYVWLHQTDALGFRNKTPYIPADIVLLGDSLIYGHGVNLEHTVGSFLEQLSGLPVANLARQGDCAFQEAYLLTEYAPVFQPRYVFYFFSPNDITDLYVYLSDRAMQKFIETPVERITYPPRIDPAVALQERARRLQSRAFLERLEDSSYLPKMFRWVKHTWRLKRARTRQEAELPPRRNADSPDVSHDENSLGWRYTMHAIRYMQYVAAKHHAEFVIASIGDQRQFEILQRTALDYGVPFVDTRTLNAASFLPRDGHLSPAGARTLAELAAEYVKLHVWPQDGMKADDRVGGG